MLKDIMRVMTSVRMIHIHLRNRHLGMIGNVRCGAEYAAAHVRNVPIITVFYLIVLMTAVILEDVVVRVD